MTNTTEFDPDDPNRPALSAVPREKPVPLGSLVAAASRLRSKKVGRVGFSSNAQGWQEDAWDMYDLVGEQRFLATTLANRLAQARLYAGRLPEDPTEEVVPTTEGPAHDVFSALDQSGQALDQIIGRLGINLFVAGDGWLVGVPRRLVEVRTAGDGGEDPEERIVPLGDEDGVDISEFDWRMMSISEVSRNASDEVVLKGWEGGDLTVKPDDVWLIRVWRPHPRKWEQADSPTRSSLPVLRELVGLTMHISAQVDSRLAGAGVFLIPQSADRAVRAAAGQTDEEGESPFVTALMESMLTPINDRASASALVPLMPVVPDESIDKFRFISFASPLDTEARNLRDEAIRRLALGQDCPPELLLGVAGMNHWGAWLVREDVVTTHIEPPLALICDALTTQFLWPVLEEQGMEPEEYRQYVIWYDVDHLITRPDRSNDAKALHGVGVISDAALRDATGFDESDAPEQPVTDPAIEIAMDLVRASPGLVVNPGIPAVVAQIRAMFEGEPGPDPSADNLPDDPDAAPSDEGGGEDSLPDPDETTGPEVVAEGPPIAASGYGLEQMLPAPDVLERRTAPTASRVVEDAERANARRRRMVTSLNVTHQEGSR